MTMSRRKPWVGLLVALLLCGCPAARTPAPPATNVTPPATSTASVGDAQPTGKVWQIAVIPKGTTHEFWKSVHAGAARAAKELGNVEILWKGPLGESDTDGQISVVQDFITRHVDGIVLAPNDSQSLVAAVADAKAEGIPTVIFDSGLDNAELTVSYVATDNYLGGALAARRLAEVLDKRGNVVLMRYKQGSESTEQREAGFLETLAKEFPEINVLSSNQYAGTTPEESLDKSQQVLITHRGEVDGVFTVCEPNGTGMLGALETEDPSGRIKFVTFDPSPRMIESMRQGRIHGIVLQDPVTMGYEAVKAMVAHLEGKPVEKRIDTGEYVATPENMQEPDMARLLSPEQFAD
jgi:ribose transport system substrate-binding protein